MLVIEHFISVLAVFHTLPESILTAHSKTSSSPTYKLP